MILITLLHKLKLYKTTSTTAVYFVGSSRAVKVPFYFWYIFLDSMGLVWSMLWGFFYDGGAVGVSRDNKKGNRKLKFYLFFFL